MERDEFLKSMSLGLALVCTGTCFSACSKSADNTSQTPTPKGGTTVDLSKQLLNVGDQVSPGNYLIFRIAAGNSPTSFVATQSACPHQGAKLDWINANNLIRCELHQSEYKKDGSIIQGPQNSSGVTQPLKLYTVTISGTTLTVS